MTANILHDGGNPNYPRKYLGTHYCPNRRKNAKKKGFLHALRSCLLPSNAKQPINTV